MSRRFLYDTAIFIYALGGEHRYREPCQDIVARAGRGELNGEAGVDLLQELAHLRLRRTRDRSAAANAARKAAALCELHELRPSDLLRALDLLEGTTRLGARDAVFAAVALNRGIDAILSTDAAFDELAELERIDPLDAAAVATLAQDSQWVSRERRV